MPTSHSWYVRSSTCILSPWSNNLSDICMFVAARSLLRLRCLPRPIKQEQMQTIFFYFEILNFVFQTYGRNECFVLAKKWCFRSDHHFGSFGSILEMFFLFFNWPIDFSLLLKWSSGRNVGKSSNIAFLE